MLILVFVNLILLWYFTHIQKEYHEPVIVDKLDVTIVIPEFENFDNNIFETVNKLSELYPDLNIIVISETLPYPYINFNSRKSIFVIRTHEPTAPRYLSDPLHFIKTKYVLVVPDGIRIQEKGNLEELIWKIRQSQKISILASPIQQFPFLCTVVDIDLKRWSLKYFNDPKTKHCDSFVNKITLLFRTDILLNFTEVFSSPFHESFYIQAKLRHLEIFVTKNKFFSLGKILFANNHYKWKHSESIKKQKVELYKRFGIKNVVDSNGVEISYGCSKQTPRCFPTVLDVPYYLYKGRWTPPCCLNALRETARHVFTTLDTYNIDYWLEGGSLLGAARHGDIIPWDYDVDIGIYMNDIQKLKLLKEVWNGVKRVDSDGFVWERAKEGDFIRVQYSNINHLHVDVFPFYEKNGIMTKNTWFKSHRQDMEFPSHYLKGLQRIYFAGYMALAPNNYRKFLEMKFGKGVIEHPQYPFPEKLRRP